MHTCGLEKHISHFNNEKYFSIFQYTHPERDKREMCIYCKNEDTKRITDLVDLKKYQEYYMETPFIACYCSTCSTTFSFKK